MKPNGGSKKRRGKTENQKRIINSESITKLLEKEQSPLVIRKTNILGFPLYVALICDYDLCDLDTVICDAIDVAIAKNENYSQNVQTLRVFVGTMCDFIIHYYDNMRRGCVEGAAVIFYADKTFVSSLFGDFMTHGMCRFELYQALNFMTQV